MGTTISPNHASNGAEERTSLKEDSLIWSTDMYIPAATARDSGNATTKKGTLRQNPTTNIGSKNIHINMSTMVTIAQRKSIVYIKT